MRKKIEAMREVEWILRRESLFEVHLTDRGRSDRLEEEEKEVVSVMAVVVSHSPNPGI